jgi:DNA-binding CsgD family transcriptional regulator
MSSPQVVFAEEPVAGHVEAVRISPPPPFLYTCRPLPDDAPHPLTPREREVLAWISKGKSNFEIGAILGISAWTVKIHVGSILGKLNASTRGHAIAKAVSAGLVAV